MTIQHLHNVYVVGNIASGKSTLTRLLGAAIPDSVAILESFEQNPFLPLSVSDPPRWAFTNAVRYFYDYVRVYREATTARRYEHYFIDAGTATNREVYGSFLSGQAIITPDEFAFYNLLCDLIERAYAHPAPDAYIFIDASPETSWKRMRARGWEYQTRHVRLEYLEILNQYHAAFRARLIEKGMPVLLLDSDTLDWQTDAGRDFVVAQVRRFLR